MRIDEELQHPENSTRREAALDHERLEHEQRKANAKTRGA